MPSQDVVVGSTSVLGDLPDAGNTAVTTPLQPKCFEEEYQDGRPKGSSALPTDLAAEQPSELEAYVEAVKALEQTKEVLAGRCVRLLTLPVEGVLDVARACSNDHGDGGLAGIRKALEALDGRMDSALVLLGELVASAESDRQGPPAAGQFDGGTLGSLLRNLSASTKHILSQLRSSAETPRADIMGSIQSAVREFSALNRSGFEDDVAIWASRELERHGGPDQRSPLSSAENDPVISASQVGESPAPPPPHFESPELLDESESATELGKDAWDQYDMNGSTDVLDKAIDHFQLALDLCPPGHSNRSQLLYNLANALTTRFEQLGQIGDLEQAINYHRCALELRPLGHPEHSSSFNNLADALSSRFKQSGQIEDLEQAISYHRRALELCPPGHRDRPTSLDNLGTALKTRFEQLGQIADLEEAISYHRRALELCPPGHRDRSSSLDNLGTALRIRFGQFGQVTDLEQAITYHHGALELCPPEHPDRSGSLANLGSALKIRFDQLGQVADLEQAVSCHHGALELYPPGNPNRPSSLNNLANALKARYEQLGQITDLEQAISCYHGAEELLPPGNPNRFGCLANLANALSACFDQLGQITDLEEAVDYHQGALGLCPPGHPNRSNCLNNLASALKTCFDRLGQIEDLEESITYLRGALELRPLGHPDRSMSLSNLASTLCTRFESSKAPEDLREAVDLLWSGAQDTTDTPKHRYTCASRLIPLLEAHNQPSLLDAYDMTLGLLQLLLAVYPDVELRREALGADKLSPSLAMSAAAYAIEQNQPEKAVEMLEQGRGMLYSNIRGYREPVEAVRVANAALADRFKTTSEQLEALATSSLLGPNRLSSESPDEPATVSNARWARQRQLSSERDKIVEDIRCLPGFEHFLKAVPFNILQVAAAEGPIIIVNVAQQRSDAIILYQHNLPIVLPLAADGWNREEAYLMFLSLSHRLFKGRTKAGFSKLLEKFILKKLAKLLVTPVLEKLEGMGVPKQSRIWWCPTSALCALPIHAAGELPVKYITSYTPTLSALISARKVDDQRPPATLNASENEPSLLAIVYPGHPPKTEDEHDDRLKTVFVEYGVIEKAARASQNRAVVRAHATREGALEQLPYHRWMHFACHGRLNISQPFQSAFELEGDPLSLSDLVHAHLPHADFAFLAACDSATSGGTTNTPDEALHLAAAVQFCGVRSVVGTLWPMADGDGPRVAQVFYRHMFKENDPRKSAEALQKVVQLMRKKAGPWKNAKDEGEVLQRWANYVHIGA
ncbi:hypothetical protein HWV62_36757 [Athelia sp. TMB]|nr:hypothetical protein HWV62_36757 [Athelia sp. TMB]